ncbi:MAG: co-chaperone GroES [Candidatus Campbellbacteria bacterium]|nr:co-chaperone GroES [Candidatus Campbellbacteria bacterium]
MAGKTGKKKDKASIVPLGDRVLIRPFTPEETESKSSSGIIIPDTVSKERPERGTVVAVGEGRLDEDGEKRIPVSVKVGDTVVFSKYGFDELELDGDEYIIVREENILAVVK